MSSTSGRISRRKIRKGTFSCWECKHRKIRCEFRPASSAICESCRRRGLECIGQEFEENAGSAQVHVEDRLRHVEDLILQLARQRGIQQPESASEAMFQQSDASNRSTGDGDSNLEIQSHLIRRQPFPSVIEQQVQSRSVSLIGYLYSVLPHPTTVAMILGRSKLCIEVSEMATASSASQPSNISAPPATHPVHIARKLIQLALCLQQLDHTASEQLQPQLNKPTREVALQFFEAASHAVTSKDELVGSLDGLETLLLEAQYHIHLGNLHAAWLVFRRAVGIAQLMGLSRSSNQGADHQVDSTWYRLMRNDRFLSLMLGLPFAAVDDGFTGEHWLPTDEPHMRLDRIHAFIAGRIITRNIRLQQRIDSNSSQPYARDGNEETREIDLRLKQAARLLPAKWWVAPQLGNLKADLEIKNNISRLLTQMHQFYLVVVLHLPYLVQKYQPQSSGSDAWPAQVCIGDRYSEIVTLPACREILPRVLATGVFFNILPHQGIVAKGFTAAITLLLAHIDSHRFGCWNTLGHERPHDLGIIENLADSLDEVSHSKQDELCGSHAHVLRKLVEIEANAADGVRYLTVIKRGTTENADCEIAVEEDGVRLPIPYLGTLHIKREGLHQLQATNSAIHLPQGEVPSAFPFMNDTNNNRNVDVDEFLGVQPLHSATFGAQWEAQLPNFTAESFGDAVLTRSTTHHAVESLARNPNHTPGISTLPINAMNTHASSYHEKDIAAFMTCQQGEAWNDESFTGSETWST